MRNTHASVPNARPSVRIVPTIDASARREQPAQLETFSRLAPKSPDEHARALLCWLRARRCESGLLHAEILQFYREMCHEAGWFERPWAPIARAFSLLTNDGKKKYASFRHIKTGNIVRRRIYPFSASDQPVAPPADANGANCNSLTAEKTP